MKHIKSPATMKYRSRYIFGTLFLIFIFLTTYKLFSTDISSDMDQLYSGYNKIRLRSDYYNTMYINLNELYSIGSCLLKEAGKRIVEIRTDKNNELKINHKEKDNSVVTKADIESHEILVHTLNHKFKKLVVNSEENSGKNDNFNVESYLSKCDNYQKKDDDLYAPVTDVNVWIDPLDATQEYSENLVEYVTVMFCIVMKGQPKAGIIYKPFEDKSMGSFFENKKYEKPKSTNSTQRIIVSRSHAGTVKSTIAENMKDAGIIIAAGSGYKTLSLLENKADLYLHTSKIYKWDVCAPNAILNNLGGKLTQRNGDIIDYSKLEENTKSVDGIIAALYDYDYYFNIFKKV